MRTYLAATLALTLSGLSFAQAPAAQPWIARSNADAQLLLVETATFSPETATSVGLDGYDAKAADLGDLQLEWVVIGHLQTNKARDVARLASEVQSLDRIELAHELDRRLQAEGRGIDVLVQVKTSPEEAKSGVSPESLPGLLHELNACASLRLRGLMTMAIASDDPAAVRSCFHRLRRLREACRQSGHELDRLSMGMSGDFALAIAEGATEVRIGSAIFGART